MKHKKMFSNILIMVCVSIVVNLVTRQITEDFFGGITLPSFGGGSSGGGIAVGGGIAGRGLLGKKTTETPTKSSKTIGKVPNRTDHYEFTSKSNLCESCKTICIDN